MSLKTKFFAFASAVLMSVCSFAASGDIAYVQKKGVLTIGITEFAPMDYKDANGRWIGFDADLANLFAKSLGVNCEFQLIDWDNKVLELNSKKIDMVWNGMTLTKEVKSAMRTSKPYLNNAQIVIVPAKDAQKYKKVKQMKDLSFAVEAGSAGEQVAKAQGLKVTPVSDQATALLEVNSGNADAAVMDSLLAAAMVGPGTNYSKLQPTIKLNKEEYGVGCRKHSNLIPELNNFFRKIYNDGTLKALAEKYRVQEALIGQ